MERAAFLIEESGERIPCLLNPASVVMRRVAGVRPRISTGGQLTGAGLADNPLLLTGGGMTELFLDLLFDVSLVQPGPQPESVQTLTEPLWRMAENQRREGEYGRPPIVRFVWGKSWNVPGVVVAVAERLEYFTQAGTPRRSWLRLRMLRALEQPIAPEPAPQPPTTEPGDFPTQVNPQDIRFHDLVGDGGGSTEPLYLVAQQVHGTPDTEHYIAEFNDIDDLLRLAPGQTLQVPPPPGGGATA
jgi:hypothetical protein